MTLRFVLSTAECKDLQPQFGAIQKTFNDCVSIGLEAIVESLIDHPLAKVYWDHSKEALESCAEKTSSFLDIPGVVGFLDGNKLRSLSPEDYYDQNRDYNGWTKDVNRNLLLLWTPHGKIVDAVVNAPGNFHDSKSARIGNIYKHISKLPDGYKVVCDDAFTTGGFMNDKLVKTKECFDEEKVRSGYDNSLTHLRQCSEWGNHTLTGVFRTLQLQMPTDNVRRAKLLWACILLCNWRCETVGRNQIKTYFDHINKEKKI